MKSLVQRANFFALAEAEKEDMIWKSYMYDMKKGTLKFLLNACIDALSTAANLQTNFSGLYFKYMAAKTSSTTQVLQTSSQWFKIL